MATRSRTLARVADLTVLAPGGRPLLDRISFELELPGSVAVMGRSGAGKSILLAALGGTFARESGSIDVPGPIGVVLQDVESVFTSASVAEEIHLALACRGVRGERATERRRAIASAIGLEALLHRDPATLSGGEQQRVQLAAAVAIAPATLLLDEPTEHLDPSAADAVEAAITALDPPPALVVRATHDIERALRSTRMLVLELGHLAAFGAPDALARDGSLERAALEPPPALVVARALRRSLGLSPPLPTTFAALERAVPGLERT